MFKLLISMTVVMFKLLISMTVVMFKLLISMTVKKHVHYRFYVTYSILILFIYFLLSQTISKACLMGKML